MNFVFALCDLLMEMAPWLLFGFFVAGVLHVFVPRILFRKFLSGNNARSVFYGALLGVPLPLCSCGVIPTAMGLRKDGASRGACVSFLISTPQTGVDSICATGALLGLPFALIRPLVAFTTGVVGGTLANWLVPEEKRVLENAQVTEDRGEKLICEEEMEIDDAIPQSFFGKICAVFRYGFGDMMQDIGLWLTVGLILAAFITVLVPDGFLVQFSENPCLGMLAILALASVMYVCATGSIPIAAALMAKGVSPGAAFILLMAGPATNLAAMFVVAKGLGRKTFWIYLTTILCGALLAALGIDFLCPREWFVTVGTAEPVASCCRDASTLWDWVKIGSAILLVLALARGLILRTGLFARAGIRGRAGQTGCVGKGGGDADKRETGVFNIKEGENQMNASDSSTPYVRRFRVKGMTCAHCRSFVEKSIREVPGVESVSVDLASGIAEATGSADECEIIQAVENAGFGIKPL